MTNLEQVRGRIPSALLRVARILWVLPTVFLVALVASPAAQAQITTLYTFTGGSDGARPNAGVVTDGQGNIYGTTYWGGNLSCNSGLGCGVVYKLTAAGVESALYSFAGGKDGAYPSAALLRVKSDYYGTTTGGGGSGCGGSGCGTVFRVSAQGKEKVLYTFNGATDGGEPSSAVIMDTAGNLYGTTLAGGDLSCDAPFGCGVVYKLAPTTTATDPTPSDAEVSATYIYSVLYTFTGPDGANPGGSLAMDAAGDVFGTTSHGGGTTCNCGVVYKLTLPNIEIVLHPFSAGTADGSYPLSGVSLDFAKLNLYGTAAQGGIHGGGVLWKVTTGGNDFKILRNFGAGSKDGKTPSAGVNVCADGSVYGSTESGGVQSYGTLWTRTRNGTYTVTDSFDYSYTGGVPVAALEWTRDPAENFVGFIGTASEGGSVADGYGSGTVWHRETYLSTDTLCSQH